MRFSPLSPHLLMFISVLSLARAQTTMEMTTITETSTAATTTATPTTATPTTTTTPTTIPTTTTPTTIPTTTTPTTIPTTTTPTTIPTTTTPTTIPTTTTPTTIPTTTTPTTIPTTTTPTTIPTTTLPWTAPAIFYPYGPAAGDTETVETGGETYINVAFSTPFTFFGRKYNSIYINNNGLLTFNQPLPEAHPSPFPTNGPEDYIAPLWTELDDFGFGKYWYHEYTSGSVLDRATQDINQHFPNRGFTVSSVFVVTWDYVLTSDMNVLNDHSAPAITFQAVLISGRGDFSFILMNYGDCAGINFPVEAGYDTVNSTDYHVIHYDPSGGYNIPTLKDTTNVGISGRWAFLVNTGTDIFYPFGPAAGDVETTEVGGETYVNVAFSTPFTFFGRKYNSIYINNNGLLTFSQPLPEAHPYPFPTYGSEDYIAALWTELDDVGYGKYWYHEYTSGSVLTRATQDIKQYFPNWGLTVSWVFVVTWDYVLTWDMNVLNEHSGPAITFQAVLIGGHGFSFMLMNYGECTGIYFPVEAGFDTVNSTDYHVIHYDYPTGYNIPTLKDLTNVGIPGRWAFLVNNRQAIFYPFGPTAGDAETVETSGDSYVNVALSTPFKYFGRGYNSVYVNNNGLLTFINALPEVYPPYLFPTFGSEDYIAALWTELDDLGYGKYWYQEYTSGSVLDRATQDINQYFPNWGFTVSSVFVVTWDYVLTWDMNVLNDHSAPAITFQAVLISGGGDFSFILMNYGDCAANGYVAEAGYDTVGSTDYHIIYYDPSGSTNIPILKDTTNVDVLGRWAFLVNNGTATTTPPPPTTTTPTTMPTTTTTPPWTAPAIFYPFGPAAGDTETVETGGETYVNVAFSTPFTFFGRKYNSIYINNNGLLTFNQPLPEAEPNQFPIYGPEDYIAALWTDLDDVGFGKYWYQEYTSGSVLDRATQDINQHFPNRGFTVSSVFVVTWDYVLTSDMNVLNDHSAPAITFQAVLISGHGDFSFILMNYGDCAGIYFPVEAGYDTVNSTDYHVIHYDSSGDYNIPTLKDTTNVGISGRWAFLVNTGTDIFYPFGPAAGDVETTEVGGESYVNVAFSNPFTFFGRKYNSIYINNNGLLTFSQPLPEAHPYPFPTYGPEDYIAALWTELDDVGLGKYWYHEYTSGSVLTRATQDIKQYFPNWGLTVSWVFVVTWDYVLTWDLNVLNAHSGPAITFQAVLIGGHGFSFMLMNYGECTGINFPVEAGFDTVGSSDYHVIHYDYTGYNIPTLKDTTNVGIPGRWAFQVNNRTAIFYPFGPAAGDAETIETGGETYVNVALSTPFTYFGRGYNSVYVNNNGLLTFINALPEVYPPYLFPTNGPEDYIAPFWTELDDLGYGKYWYQEYTSGSVLDRATQDINLHFPNRGFTVSSVFVVTWDYVLTWDMNVLNEHSAPGITFQAVLISGGGNFSFILMNYGDCAGSGYVAEAGYDTIGSTDYHVIYYDYPPGSGIPNLSDMSNVGVPGRWAFLVNNGTENILGVQIKVTSFEDLIQTGNIEDVLQKIKNVLVSRGVSSNFGLKLRKVQKINP